MIRHLNYLVIGAGLAALLLIGVACSTDLKPVENRVGAVEQDVTGLESKVAGLESKVTGVESGVGKIGAPAGQVEFFVTGVEWKGTTSANDLDAPSIDPATLSDGYGYKGPGVLDSDNPDNWQVASYVWTPGSMVAYEGDTVALNFFIINGNTHSTWVEGPDGAEVVQELEMNRGREYSLSFAATKAGVYRLICNEHEPTMTANILVLPRG